MAKTNNYKNDMERLTKNGIDAIIFGTTEYGDAVFRMLLVSKLTATLYSRLFENGIFRLRTKKRPNFQILQNLPIVHVCSRNQLESHGIPNNGYNAECELFGAANYTDDLCDGIFHGLHVQVKTSFNFDGKGASTAHEL